MVQRVISAYRKRAKAMLLREDPELREAVIARKQEAHTNARAVYGGIADLAQ